LDVEGDTLNANLEETVEEYREDDADFDAAESACDANEVAEVSHVSESTHRGESADTSVDERGLPSVAERPSKPTKFIDRRTETLISACATISTPAANDITATRTDTGDVVEKCETAKPATSPILRPRRDRKARDVGVVDGTPVHRSMLPKVASTSKTTALPVPTVDAPAAWPVRRSEQPQSDRSTAVTCSATPSPVVSPRNAESRLTVTLAESTSQPSQRNCRLITRSATTVASTKPRAGSGSDDEVSARPVVARDQSDRRLGQRRRSSSERSVDEPEVKSPSSTRPRSTVCVLALLSPVTVQPGAGPSRTALSERQVSTALTVSAAGWLVGWLAGLFAGLLLIVEGSNQIE